MAQGKKSTDPTLVKIAEEVGKSWAQVLIRWSLQRGYVRSLPLSAMASIHFLESLLALVAFMSLLRRPISSFTHLASSTLPL